MVDLHQGAPALPETHPWMSYSRWGTAWRAWLGVVVTAMIGSVAGSLVISGGPNPMLMYAVTLVGILPVICGALAAVFGPWLRRFYPFSQSLIFAGITTGAVWILLATVSVAESILRGPCPPDVLCSDPLGGLYWGVILFGLPAFLFPCVGFGLAIWAPTRRGQKWFWPVAAGAIVVFGTFLAFALLHNGL